MKPSKAAIVVLLVAVPYATPGIAAPTFDARTTVAAHGNRTPAGSVLTLTGYGTIRIGAKPGDIRSYTLTSPYGQNDECYVAGVKEVPDLALLVTNGVIKRISIGEHSSSPIKTDRGIGIGSTQAAVLKAYPSTSIRPHQYDIKPSAYLMWLSPDRMSGVRFETGADRKVKVIHVGSMPELGYVERCS